MSAMESCDVLAGGQWVVVRGVSRWTPEPEPPVLTLVPQPARELDIRCMIACPYCHATVTESCKRKNGRERQPHIHRLLPRRCICGEIPPPRKTYCRFCRAEKRAESREKYETTRKAGAA